MEGNCVFKWLDMDVRRRLIEAVEVVVAEDHVVEVEIVDVLDLDPAVDRVAAIEIAGAPIAAVAAALVLTAKVRAANHAHAASLRTGKRTVVPNLGTELEVLVRAYKRITMSVRASNECRIIYVEDCKRYSITYYSNTRTLLHVLLSFKYIHVIYIYIYFN